MVYNGKSQSKVDDLGVPLFMETPISLCLNQLKLPDLRPQDLDMSTPVPRPPLRLLAESVERWLDSGEKYLTGSEMPVICSYKPVSLFMESTSPRTTIGKGV